MVPRAEDEWAEALAAVWSGAHALSPVVRTRQDGTRALMAEGSDRQGPRRLEVAGQLQRWTERRLVGRARRQAQAAEGGLRTRVAQAMAAREAWNQRGRGTKRFDEVSA